MLRAETFQALATSTQTVEATFSVPFRPKVFHKTKRLSIDLTREALARDEVFLFLVFIYSEAKRQEKMNSGGGW